MPAIWNPLDPEFKVDPYPAYQALLEREPFHRSPMGPLVLSRYDDCLTLLRHPAVSTDSRKVPGWTLPNGMDPDELSPSFLSLDPPDHTRLRGLVARAFIPRRVDALRPRMLRHACGPGVPPG
jgi:cytochrome P450